MENKIYYGCPMALETELATYNAKLPELKGHEGMYVLIQGDKVVDFYTAYEDAIKAGYEKFQLRPFLVKRISAIETVQHVTRSVLPYARTA
jgi:hypothetical protein